MTRPKPPKELPAYMHAGAKACERIDAEIDAFFAALCADNGIPEPTKEYMRNNLMSLKNVNSSVIREMLYAKHAIASGIRPETAH